MSENNAAGFWESSDILALNENLLRAHDSTWDDWRAFDNHSAITDKAHQWAEDIVKSVAERFNGPGAPVIKDPRLCRLWPVWASALEADGAPHFVLPLRQPMEVARSLKARDELPLTTGLLLWLRHVLDAERFSRHQPRCFALYDALLDDGVAAIERIRGVLSLPLNPRDPEAALAIRQHLRLDLRHQQASLSSLETIPQPLRSLVARTFDTFTPLCADPGADHDQTDRFATLDALHDEFDDLCALLAPEVARRGNTSSSSDAHSTEAIRPPQPNTDELRIQIAEQIGVNDERLHQLRVAHEKLEVQRERCGVLEERLRNADERFQRELRPLNTELAAARKNATSLEDRALAAEKAHAQAEARASSLEDKYVARNAEYDELHSRHDRSQRELRAARDQVNALQVQVRAAERALKAAETELVAAQEGHKLISAELECRQARHDDELAASRQHLLSLLQDQQQAHSAPGASSRRPRNPPGYARFLLSNNLFWPEWYRQKYGMGGWSAEQLVRSWLA
ncbi:MAG: hypothetical protein ABF296_01660, partial [Oceanococcaceae bacterium]